MNLFVKGNEKVGPEVFLFNLPAPKTCVPTEWCDKNCYAREGHFLHSNVGISHGLHHSASMSRNFVDMAVEEIKRRRATYVRIHGSGDFYSAPYVMKWVNIAQALPKVHFKTTTRRGGAYNLRPYILALQGLPNVALYESLDPFQDTPVLGGLVAVTEDTYTLFHLQDPGVRKRYEESRRCPWGCQPCGYKCWLDPKNIIWPVH